MQIDGVRVDKYLITQLVFFFLLLQRAAVEMSGGFFEVYFMSFEFALWGNSNISITISRVTGQF